MCISLYTVFIYNRVITTNNIVVSFITKGIMQNWHVMDCGFQTSLIPLRLALKWMRYDYKLFKFRMAIYSRSKVASDLTIYVWIDMFRL
jgi:hypothetical protein